MYLSSLSNVLATHVKPASQFFASLKYHKLTANTMRFFLHDFHYQREDA